MSNNPHPISCCCWEDGWPTPTLEISYATDFGLFYFKGTGYAGQNLFVEESWGNNPDFFYDDMFGPDRNGIRTNSGQSVGDFGICDGKCQPYNYEHLNNFVDDAEEYDTPTDPCWDWSEFTINMDYNNVLCGSSIYNPAIQIPDPNDPNQMIPDPERICECDNWDTRESTREITCQPFGINSPDYQYCPLQFYPTITPSGRNWCGGNSVFDINAPNITRDFKKAFIDDGEIERNPADLQYGDYFYVGGLGPIPSFIWRERTKKDHRKNWRKAKFRARFVVPPTCYLKIWAKAKITTYGCSEGSCRPDTIISEETHDLTPIEWVGTEENCYSTAGYPFGGNTQTVDIINSLSEIENDLEFAFFDEYSGGIGKIEAPQKPLGVTCGHEKRMIIAFKYSWIQNYEPEWGCGAGFVEQPEGSGQYTEGCFTYDIFDLGGNPSPEATCLNTNALPTPLCHAV